MLKNSQGVTSIYLDRLAFDQGRGGVNRCAPDVKSFFYTLSVLASFSFPVFPHPR
jgi:hypothetical protein